MRVAARWFLRGMDSPLGILEDRTVCGLREDRKRSSTAMMTFLPAYFIMPVQGIGVSDISTLYTTEESA